MRFLEAEILLQNQNWAAAIARMETDRAVLRSFPRLSSRLDLMLADCYGRMGADELRLDALRRAAEGNPGRKRPAWSSSGVLARSGRRAPGAHPSTSFAAGDRGDQTRRGGWT